MCDQAGGNLFQIGFVQQSGLQKSKQLLSNFVGNRVKRIILHHRNESSIQLTLW